MGYESTFLLTGKTALVAGASRGIGQAIGRAISESGAHTVLAARSIEPLEREAEGLRTAGWSAEAARLDVTDPVSVKTLAAAYPDVDILVNVAGTNLRKPFPDYTEQEYRYLLATNLDGIVLLTQLLGKRMVERGRGGKVILVGSLTSTVGLPNVSIYTITKSAIAGLTRALAAEWGRNNIQVNCICPGFIITDLNRAMWQPEAMRAWLRANQANPEPGAPADIAPLAVFLAGRGSDYVTGQLLFADGGNNTTAVWPFESWGS